MNWDLYLSIDILIGASLALCLVSNKSGAKYITLYGLTFILLRFYANHFLFISPIFLLLLLLINITEIRGLLILGLGLMTSTATVCLIAISGIYQIPPVYANIFFVRDLVASTSIVTGLIYALPRHKDYLLSLTFIAFSVFIYSYANPVSPLLRVAFPFAALSLLPYLGMTVINNHFEGSFAHIYLTKGLRALAKRLKVGGDSKYTSLALQIFRLK